MAAPRVALLHQAAKPPEVAGVNKPMKPGGYQDSCADIAFALQQKGITVVTPKYEPSPDDMQGWSFPDTEAGILAALSKGASHMWANTILFKTHPLQISSTFDDVSPQLNVIGQPPLLVELYDDKNYVNSMLRADGRFSIPNGWIVDTAKPAVLSQLKYPVVGKPIRGRGSYGVKVCRSQAELTVHLAGLLKESSQVMIEDFLAGEEGTITVLPPSPDQPRYTALPIVVRFDQHDDVAPYNGNVAVTQNSRVPSDEEFAATPAYEEIQRQCELVAEKMRATATMRIDVRQAENKAQAKFWIFDVNMKPNMTGPGRPGRDDQASLSALAAAKLGWSFGDLVERMLTSAQPLSRLRRTRLDQ